VAGRSTAASVSTPGGVDSSGIRYPYALTNSAPRTMAGARFVSGEQIELGADFGGELTLGHTEGLVRDADHRVDF
jgi:hypothetical protein